MLSKQVEYLEETIQIQIEAVEEKRVDLNRFK